MLSRFIRDRKASVAPLLALTAIPLFGFVGAAVDYSRANSTRTAMQSALDATTLLLAKTVLNTPNASISEQAKNYFSANFTNPGLQNLAATANSAPVAGGVSVTGTASGSVDTRFMKVLGFSSITLAVRSVALATSDGLGCVLALNTGASGAITIQGSSSVTLASCSVYDNSAHSTALVAGGSSSLSAYSIGIVGGVSNTSNITTTQGIHTNSNPVADPYANDSYPAPSGNCQNQPPIHNTRTLSPGFMCGLTLNGNADVTLNPGIYYIGQGGLNVTGTATMSGSGVTLVFTSSNGHYGSATINGGATVNLTAPTFGPTTGIVIFGDRNMPSGTTFDFNGGATQYLGGAVYVPKGAIQYAGGASSSSGCTQIIGDTVKFTGNSSVAINCSSLKTKPFSPTTVRLIS
jgi:Flp pilus assembly protein TadG